MTRILTGLLAVALLGATSIERNVPTDVWPMFQYAPHHNAVFDRPNWDVTWKAPMGNASNGGISIVGSTLYIDSFDHYVYAFDALNGTLRWKRQLTNVLMNVPIVANGVVIVGTGKSGLLTFSDTFWTSGRREGDSIFGLSATTGEILWRFDTVGENMPTGVYTLVNGRPEFVFCGGDDHVYALNPTTGALIWKQRTLGIDGMASLNLFGDTVVGETTLSDAGYFAHQDSASHEADYFNWTWAIDLSGGGQYVWQAPYGVGDASAVIGDGIVFVQGFKLMYPTGADAARANQTMGWANLANNGDTRWANVISALDQKTGERLWSFESAPGSNDTYGSASFTADAVFAHHVVYEPLPFSRELAAFEAKTGKQVWRIKTHGAIKTSPLVRDGILYVGDVNGYYYVIQASDGSIIHELKFPGAPQGRGFAKSPAVIVGNTLYVSDGPYVYALRVSDLNSGTLSVAPSAN